jgi:hypothetical protein
LKGHQKPYTLISLPNLDPAIKKSYPKRIEQINPADVDFPTMNGDHFPNGFLDWFSISSMFTLG